MPAAFSLVLSVVLLFSSGAGSAFSGGGGQEDVILLWRGLRINAHKAGLLVAPGSEQAVRFSGRRGALDVRGLACKGEGWCQARNESLHFRAPSVPGNYQLAVKLEVRPVTVTKDRVSKDKRARAKKGKRIQVIITCLVGFPSSLLDHGLLNGFELGEYPDWREMDNPELYKPPAYFYLLDYEVIGLWISEHIRLGDLGYDGRAPIPQYFALDYELVKKLELLLCELEARGLPSRYHYIGGGFISPKSNQLRMSKNSAAAKRSRHLWGEAVDFIIDEDPQDEIMDDMNGDGWIDVRDAFVIRDILTELEESGRCKAGGIGGYSPPRHSQLQLHVDVRGFPTRWGYKEYDAEEFAGEDAKRSLRPGG